MAKLLLADIIVSHFPSFVVTSLGYYLIFSSVLYTHKDRLAENKDLFTMILETCTLVLSWGRCSEVSS